MDLNDNFKNIRCKIIAAFIKRKEDGVAFSHKVRYVRAPGQFRVYNYTENLHAFRGAYSRPIYLKVKICSFG